jgi:hypothetical protein
VRAVTQGGLVQELLAICDVQALHRPGSPEGASLAEYRNEFTPIPDSLGFAQH